MAPKKKKNVYNDFYFFMQDQKKVLRREGRGWETMEDLAAICAGRWRLVTDSDRARYKQMAKNHKEQERKNLANKFDAQGRSLLSLEEERQAEKRKDDKMMKEISEIIDREMLAKTLPNKKFFFFHINTLVEAGEKKFFPCQMAVIEFSLKDGISTVFNTYMSPEEHRIPMGYSFEIQQNASESHGLPLDCEPMRMREASSWSWIVAKFLDMVNPKRYDEAFPPLFTIGEDAEKIEIMLEAVFAWAGQRMRQDIRIYHVNELFNAITQKLSEERRFPKSGGGVFATTQLETDKYTFDPGMACNWHDYNERPQFCSLQKIKSWAYVISKHCCEEFNIEMISERHKPKNITETQQNKKKNIPPIKKINICPWIAPGVKEDEVAVAPTNELFGHVPKTKAAPAGYTPFVPEGCGLLVNKNPGGGGGLTWADCDDEEDPVLIPEPPPTRLNAAGKEASPAIPSPAYYVWGDPDSVKPKPSLATSSNHLTNSSLNPNIIKSTTSSSNQTKNLAQQVPPIPEHVEAAETFVKTEELAQPLQNAEQQEEPISWPADNQNNFPSLSTDSFPSLSAKPNTSAPPKSRGKKGKGRKGQQVMTLGVQRMSIN